nr:NAD(P)H-hydrate epimerase [Acidimicrobiia bacterium]
MKPVLSVEEMQKVDAEAPVPVDTLMDAAGYAVSIAAAEMGGTYGATVRVLCGKGNNGGDGFVAARYLHRRGARVIVHYVGLPDPDSAAGRAFDAAAASGVRFVPLGEPQQADLVIDALYGTGFQGELPSETVPWIPTPAPVLSVDIPSGVLGDTGETNGPSFRADRTVTFHALKPGHLLGLGPDLCGDIDVADIGLEGGDPSMNVVEDADVVIPRRDRRDHKWR